jgi:hypothetical protein
MENKSLASAALILSIIAAILGALDALGLGVWLSANSWLLVAAVLGIWSIVFKKA